MKSNIIEHKINEEDLHKYDIAEDADQNFSDQITNFGFGKKFTKEEQNQYFNVVQKYTKNNENINNHNHSRRLQAGQGIDNHLEKMKNLNLQNIGNCENNNSVVCGFLF